jgi:hypothetical protein
VEKREQVFISSTYTDLVEERQEVIQTLLEADCIPTGMELFPASNEQRWELIKRVIEGCDYYIVVVGGRYGSLDPEGISYTEREFQYAEEIGLPILGFVHADPESIELGKSEKDEEARRHLDAFLVKVKERMCKTWRSPGELGAQVAKSLIQVRKNFPAEGWVRARDAISPETRTEIAELRERVAELERELSERNESASMQGELAQGLDRAEVCGHFHYECGDSTERDNFFDGWTMTWDEIIRELGPHMLDECTQAKLQEVLQQHVFVMSTGIPHHSLPENCRIFHVALEDWSFNRAIVQLFALGFIERGQRRRGVYDRNIYWRLTKRGEDYLMRVLAARRPTSNDETPAQLPPLGWTDN